MRYTLTLVPQDAAAWTDADLAVTLGPHLTLHKTTISPRVKPYSKPVTTQGAGSATVVTYEDVQRPKAKANAKRFRPVKVTVLARVSKTAPAGALPAAITATLCSAPVGTLDVRRPEIIRRAAEPE